MPKNTRYAWRHLRLGVRRGSRSEGSQAIQALQKLGVEADGFHRSETISFQQHQDSNDLGGRRRRSGYRTGGVVAVRANAGTLGDDKKRKMS